MNGERVPCSGDPPWPPGTTPAATGIKNHGNTCYMNAVLQCLSHTDVIAEYFVLDHFKVPTYKFAVILKCFLPMMTEKIYIGLLNIMFTVCKRVFSVMAKKIAAWSAVCNSSQFRSLLYSHSLLLYRWIYRKGIK